MIKTDSLGIIGQHDPSEPSYCDMGDAPSRNGLAILCGMDAFSKVLPLFEVEKGLLRRHPTQRPWCYTPLSRDQYLPYIAGCWASGQHELVKRTIVGIQDLMSPSNLLHWILCAKVYPLYAFLPFGYIWLIIEIIYNALFNRKNEHNQLICQLIVAGKPFVKLYKFLYPNYRDNIFNYFCGWRDLPELHNAIIKKLDEY